MNKEQFIMQCKRLGLSDYLEDDCAVLYDEKGNHCLLFIWSRVFAPEKVVMRTYCSWADEIEMTAEEFLALTKTQLNQIVTVTNNTNDHINGHKQTIEGLKEVYPDHISKVLRK